MTPEQLEIARANAQRIVNAGGTDAIDYPVAVGFLSLIAQVEALTVPQWISVEDRLPEDAMQVLAYSSKRKLVSTCYHYTDDSGTGWGSAVLYGSEITHWMSTPAAPTIPAIPGTKEGA